MIFAKMEYISRGPALRTLSNAEFDFIVSAFYYLKLEFVAGDCSCIISNKNLHEGDSEKSNVYGQC